MAQTHGYDSRLSWRGTTSGGYEDYDRTHRMAVGQAPDSLTLSSDPAFAGDGELPNPEQLLLAAVSSCQMLTFLAVAARSRIDVVAYDDHALAVMPSDAQPMRITRIRLRPRILIAAGDIDRVRRLVDRAHKGCFIANTVNAEILIEPTVELYGGQTGGDAR